MTTPAPDLAAIRQWINRFLKEDCGVTEEIVPEHSLVSYLDSFHFIDFLLACEEQFPSPRQLDFNAFAELSIDQAAALIAEKIAA